MRGCQFLRDGDRLLIRPTTGTVAAPLIVVAFLGTAMANGAYQLAQLPVADVEDRLTGSQTWFYLPMNLAEIAGAIWWYRAISGPIVLDRRTGGFEAGGRHESLAGAVAIAVSIETSNESADSYFVDVKLPGRRVRLGRFGWTDETDRTRAEANARIVAEFLGLPIQLAPVA